MAKLANVVCERPLMKLLFRYLTLISSKEWTHIRQIRNNRLILAQFQTVSTQEYAKVYCTYKSAIIIGLDHKLRSASYQNLPICMKVVSRQTYIYNIMIF